ncbi:MAG: DUF4445 domain-containing protein [Sedimentisphaerales bacterium]|nr:DUF4445 domain-containing protein [Sedimentisphaerales bacterium]
MFKVQFQPDGLSTHVPEGMTVLAAAEQVGIVLNSVCGGRGTCGKCLVEVEGEAAPVKACLHVVARDMVVTIPETSRFFEQKILSAGTSGPVGLRPGVEKYFVQPAEPSLDDLRSDSERLLAAVNAQRSDILCNNVTLSALRQLPLICRQNGFSLTAVCRNQEIFAVEAGDTRESLWGLAVDVGTTTVVVSLLNLRDGEIVATSARTNPQVSFGDDVISRIEASRTTENGLQILQKRIIEGLNQLIDELCQKTGVEPDQIYEITVAGNTTMEHLLLGVSVGQIAQAPYIGAFSSAVNVTANNLGLNINPSGNVYVFPGVAAHVGGDTIAVILATRLDEPSEIHLAIDIGTNGELALSNGKHLAACSTAAGPAFEGARIRHGMRGAAGAIERVFIREDVEVATIGDGPPTGICGSGLIDALAELLQAGILDSSGRFLTVEELPDSVSPALRERLCSYDGQAAFILVHPSASKHGQAIVLSQRDVREAQVGKAAISAGLEMLLRHLKVSTMQIDRLYLAGAFGNYIRPQSARRIGLLPDIPLAKIFFVGNAAADGARLALLDITQRRRAEEIARRVDYLELAGTMDFQHLFSEKMFFPEP